MNETLFIFFLLTIIAFSFLLIFSKKNKANISKYYVFFDFSKLSKYHIFRATKNFIRHSIKVSLLLIVFTYSVWSGFEYLWYRGCIPREIGVTFPVGISGQSGFREGCGAAVFFLSSSTTELIEKKGIDFFTYITHSRKSDKYYHTYDSWSETPVPASWTNEGAWLGLSCWKPLISFFFQ